MKQLSLLDSNTKSRYGRTAYGGLASKGHRKLERPFARNKWMHLVLKSHKAYGRLSLFSPRNKRFVKPFILAKAEKFGVELGDFVNAGNHLHMKVRTASKPQFQAFLRSITGRIARYVTGSCRGKSFGKFWQGLAYTRVLVSRLEELRLRNYFCANRTEMVAGRAQREEFLTEFNAWLRQERRRARGRAPDVGSVGSFEDLALAWV